MTIWGPLVWPWLVKLGTFEADMTRCQYNLQREIDAVNALVESSNLKTRKALPCRGPDLDGVATFIAENPFYRAPHWS